MNINNVRKKYLDFFEKKGHKIVSSSSLLPENDPTTLFTGSGMQPMVTYLLGEKHPAGVRVADSQKCFRTQDIEDVGDNRHTTFFEMLGNWSFGDYFKDEQISWVYEFVTKELGLNPERLYVTCFRGDENIKQDSDSAVFWQLAFKDDGIDANIVDLSEKNGMQGGRIFYYDESKNWWSRSGLPRNMPVGEPGGPDSEMFWDFVPNRGNGHLNDLVDKSIYGEFCHVNCDCGRFLEIGNSVFMEFKKTNTGFDGLSQKNVDFGGGLERLTAAVKDSQDIFNISVFDKAREILNKVSGYKYGENKEHNFAFRVILDHLRAATFLIADGAIPSNKDQGYFTRRLIRRAVRFAHQLGVNNAFCDKVSAAFINEYKEVYPSLYDQQDKILREINEEEIKFKQTLKNGMKKFEELAINNSSLEISGQDAFDLYQSFGFPIELTEELAREKKMKIDMLEFEKEKEKHQHISRQGIEKKFKGGLADESEMSIKYHTATHLLHAAIQKVLGPHAIQKGSNITPERLRFDFAHPEKVTDEQKEEIENLVNIAISAAYPVTFKMMTVEEAKESGAIGLFEGKYGETVKVYSVGNPEKTPDANKGAEAFSREFCGGPHVENTSSLGHFKIKKEESISAGIRRIKAILE